MEKIPNKRLSANWRRRPDLAWPMTIGVEIDGIETAGILMLARKYL